MIKEFDHIGKEPSILLKQKPLSLGILASYQFMAKKEPMIKKFDYLGKESGRSLRRNIRSLAKLASYKFYAIEEPTIKEFDFLYNDLGRLLGQNHFLKTLGRWDHTISRLEGTHN